MISLLIVSSDHVYSLHIKLFAFGLQQRQSREQHQSNQKQKKKCKFCEQAFFVGRFTLMLIVKQ